MEKDMQVSETEMVMFLKSVLDEMLYGQGKLTSFNMEVSNAMLPIEDERGNTVGLKESKIRTRKITFTVEDING